jgi:prenyltransferase/squalene oxidase-like repeat protein
VHDVNARLVDALARARAGEAFGPRPGSAAEAEPTALAAIALQDDASIAWLEGHQHPDGGFGLRSGVLDSDASTSVAAIALPDGDARARALDHLVANRAVKVPSSAATPHDPTTRGWGWTPDTFGWVEPTARALLALRLGRPSAAPQISDGLAVLADRECVGGGWNYGNREVLGVDLPPYVQTTAIALLGAQDELPEQRDRALSYLASAWRNEPGGLSLAITLAAFRVLDVGEADAVQARLAREFETHAFLGDVVSTAWAVIATGRALDRLRVAA